jgi:hypothetical protein
MRALGLTLISQLCATYIHAVSANTFEYYYTYPVFWMLLGAYVTVTEQQAVTGTIGKTPLAFEDAPAPRAIRSRDGNVP